MNHSLILALDQGTNSTRAILFDHKGNAVFQSSKEVSLNRIDSLRVEQNPLEILESARLVIDNAFANVPDGCKIEFIGIATQRSSLLAMDKKGNPLSPVISWQDRRTENEILCYGNSEQQIKKLTGLPLSPHYGASKFKWLLENSDSVKKANFEENLMLAPLVSFLLFNLLDNQIFAADHANAHRTLLMNLNSGQWDNALLNIFNLNLKNLPSCSPVYYNYGSIKGIPVTAVSGDQNAAVFSEGNLSVNSVLINAGTGAFILRPVGSSPVYHPKLLSGLSDSRPDDIQYTLEGTVNGAASAILWAKHKLGISSDLDLNKILTDDIVPDMFINTVGGLGSPFWKSGPESGWVNQPQSQASALAGVIESIVFLIKINLDEMNYDMNIKEVFLSGGVSSLDFFCQNLADYTGIKISRLSMTEATARGIAFLAAGKPSLWAKNPVHSFYPKKVNSGKLLRFKKFKEYIRIS